MRNELYISLVIGLAPSINSIVKTTCLVLNLWLLARYDIIKPTRR